MDLEQTIIPAKELSIATKLDDMKTMIMQDIAGSDKKVKALVNTKFDEARLAANLPDKSDIKARIKKGDKLSLKY